MCGQSVRGGGGRVWEGREGGEAAAIEMTNAGHATTFSTVNKRFKRGRGLVFAGIVQYEGF